MRSISSNLSKITQRNMKMIIRMKRRKRRRNMQVTVITMVKEEKARSAEYRTRILKNLRGSVS